MYRRIVRAGVGALERSEKGDISVAEYSSGGERVDVLAPGSKIMSLTYGVNKDTRKPVDENVYMWGTSMASPMVSGVAALVFKANPSLSGAQVKKAICDMDKSSKAFAGKDGNTTPSRPMVDAELAVKRAKDLKGDAGELTERYKKEDEEEEISFLDPQSAFRTLQLSAAAVDVREV